MSEENADDSAIQDFWEFDTNNIQQKQLHPLDMIHTPDHAPIHIVDYYPHGGRIERTMLT